MCRGPNIKLASGHFLRCFINNVIGCICVNWWHYHPPDGMDDNDKINSIRIIETIIEISIEIIEISRRETRRWELHRKKTIAVSNFEGK